MKNIIMASLFFFMLYLPANVFANVSDIYKVFPYRDNLESTVKLSEHSYYKVTANMTGMEKFEFSILDDENNSVFNKAYFGYPSYIYSFPALGQTRNYIIVTYIAGSGRFLNTFDIIGIDKGTIKIIFDSSNKYIQEMKKSGGISFDYINGLFSICGTNGKLDILLKDNISCSFLKHDSTKYKKPLYNAYELNNLCSKTYYFSPSDYAHKDDFCQYNERYNNSPEIKYNMLEPIQITTIDVDNKTYILKGLESGAIYKYTDTKAINTQEFIYRLKSFMNNSFLSQTQLDNIFTERQIETLRNNPYVQLGYTDNMVRLVNGAPNHTSSTSSYYGEIEVWSYDKSCFISLINGIVTNITYL